MFKEGNAKIRREVLEAVEGLSDSELNRKPAEDEWSPMEILEHLYLMETYIAHNLKKKIAEEKGEKTFKKPVQLTVNRLVKVNAPVPVVPSGDYITLDEMKIRLASSRTLLNEVYDGTTADLLEGNSMRHPVFGKMPLIQWFPFIGLHEQRHLKQLEKTIKKIKQDPAR